MYSKIKWPYTWEQSVVWAIMLMLVVVVKSLCLYGRNTTCKGTWESWFWPICGSSTVDFVGFWVFMWGNVCFLCVFVFTTMGGWIVIVVVWLLVVMLTCGNKWKTRFLSLHLPSLSCSLFRPLLFLLCNTTNLYIIISLPLLLSVVPLICIHVLFSYYTCCRGVWKLSFVRQPRRILKSTAE